MQKLEQEADRILGLTTKRRGRKIASEYPVLTPRQLKTRQSKEVLLGDNEVSRYPGRDGWHTVAKRDE